MDTLPQKQLKPFLKVVAILVLAFVYYGTAEISRYVAASPESVTTVWPPDGFAAAAILVFGYQILPGVLIGSFLANIWAFFNPDSWFMAITSVLQVLGIAIGTTLGVGVGNYLLRRSIKGRNPFRRLDDTYKFLFLLCILTPIINATVGAVCLYLGGKINLSIFSSVWMTWAISNVGGICIFTPAILSWFQLYYHLKIRKEQPKAKAQNIYVWKLIEASFLTIIVITISYISFFEKYGFEYILIPCLVWATLRFGQFAATNLIVVISMIAVIGTVRGLGTFATQQPNYSLMLLQSFIIVIVLTTLSLIAILAEKQRAIAKLQDSEISLIDKSIELENSKTILSDNAAILKQQNLDLAESKKAAEEANRIKSEFLSNMSHELRTPLNAILGLTQILQNSKKLNYLEKSDVKTIYQSGIHLLALIDDILDISKIEAGKMELYLQNLNFSEFLKDLVDMVEVQANQKDIDFICYFSPDLPQLVRTDSKRLKQILLNLLSNAIKFTIKGRVILRVSSDKLMPSSTLINFEVEDSGIGIDNDQLESIFLPFEQTGKIKLKAQGTGLGLTISQKVAEMMGAKITVTSNRGIGSIFAFKVCLEVPKVENLDYKQKVCIDNDKSVLDQNLAQKLPLKILLAEDNIVNQKVASRILNRLGYEIDIVDNGLKVLEILDRNFYDVILMDVQMPEMDGIEATKHIISDIDLVLRPYVIAVTANAMESDRLDCLAAGMNDFISKPIKLNLLVEALLRSRQINEV